MILRRSWLADLPLPRRRAPHAPLLRQSPAAPHVLVGRKPSPRSPPGLRRAAQRFPDGARVPTRSLDGFAWYEAGAQQPILSCLPIAPWPNSITSSKCSDRRPHDRRGAVGLMVTATTGSRTAPVHKSGATNPVWPAGPWLTTPTVAFAGRCRCHRRGKQPCGVTLRHVESLHRAVTHPNAEQQSLTA
jgi:hypothetical protein